MTEDKVKFDLNSLKKRVNYINFTNNGGCDLITGVKRDAIFKNFDSNHLLDYRKGSYNKNKAAQVASKIVSKQEDTGKVGGYMTLPVKFSNYDCKAAGGPRGLVVR